MTRQRSGSSRKVAFPPPQGPSASEFCDHGSFSKRRCEIDVTSSATGAVASALKRLGTKAVFPVPDQQAPGFAGNMLWINKVVGVLVLGLTHSCRTLLLPEALNNTFRAKRRVAKKRLR